MSRACVDLCYPCDLYLWMAICFGWVGLAVYTVTSWATMGLGICVLLLLSGLYWDGVWVEQ